MEEEKILLHACCAVCAAYPIKKLQTMGFVPIVYFYNPNIYPESEYKRRLNELIEYCDKNKIELHIGDYEDTKWRGFVEGLENEPEKGKRCEKCFYFRLERSAKKALELNISNFTTTLSVSPHKISDKIFEEADKISKKYGINFIKENFKKENGFIKTMQIAKENNFYRQQYCGCEFSIRG